MFFGFLITFLCHESYITFLLQHPFCGHGYTRAVIQDLLDTYKRKKGDKGNIAGPGDDDDDEDDAAPVDEVRLLRSVMWLLLFPRVVLKKVGCQLKFQVRQCKDTVCYWTIVSTQSQMPVALFSNDCWPKIQLVIACISCGEFDWQQGLNNNPGFLYSVHFSIKLLVAPFIELWSFFKPCFSHCVWPSNLHCFSSVCKAIQVTWQLNCYLYFVCGVDSAVFRE